MKKQNTYIITKVVTAQNVSAALRREKFAEVVSIQLQNDGQPIELPPAIGFHVSSANEDDDMI